MLDTAPTATSIRLVCELLGESVQRIAQVAAGRNEEDLRREFRPEEWSVSEILAHLRGCADVWSATIYAMLRDEEPVLTLHAPREWSRKKGYARLDFANSFQVFIIEREELLRTLGPLPLPAWERGASIGGRRHTVYSQARRLAEHEAVHCAQIENLLR
jgi:hypothetical protein